eukprot:5438097-Amphidinium_carterae.1
MTHFSAHQGGANAFGPRGAEVLKEKGIVGPAEWFQALLSQGVLFMNAACTLLPPGGGKTASEAVGRHLSFWEPAIAAVVEAILKERKKEGKGVEENERKHLASSAYPQPLSQKE